MDYSITTMVFISFLLFIISTLYSSVGHGGASGYLAILSLFAFLPNEMATTALILNIFVSVIAFYFYNKAGYFSFKLALPFIITSIPAAFIGGLLHISNEFYYLLLSMALIFAAIRMIIPSNENKEQSELKLPKYPVMLTSGAGIGFLSGIVGIGGGIFLSPIMILMKWADTKQTSATASLFILVNSIAGITGRYIHNDLKVGTLLPFLIAALIGGSIGSYMGSHKFSSLSLRKILSVVLFVAAVKSIMKCF